MTWMHDGPELWRSCRLDHAELKRIARERFDVTADFTITRQRGGKWAGRAQAQRENYPGSPIRYKVSVESRSTGVEAALRTLAHELTHLAQYMRLGWDEALANHRAEAVMAWRDRPSEIEARAMEVRWDELLPAVRFPDDGRVLEVISSANGESESHEHTDLTHRNEAGRVPVTVN